MPEASRVVLITGASRGIGRACALALAARGWSIGVNYTRDAAAADATAAAIERNGGEAFVVQADVADEAAVVAMFDALAARFGRIDALVNNAGIVAASMPLADMDGTRLKRLFEVNVLGAYLCAREAARRMSTDRGGRGGAIVNVSSAAARLGSPNEYVDYAGSKGAVDTMTIGLAKELGPRGVRVNAVRPGLIETEIHASGGRPDRAAVLGAQSPLGRPGTAEEVAEAIVWLLGDEASYVTGALLDVAGGR
ncbi:SDR family oxidoreductase [Trinickia caryophylli]|uniref:NAD(P)-dependent dehydrogenase, short-chain alcohol dehydrogenase family n=1 Tax=Trinickia caryophylli TaxID=28094 RepID=A0A1X7GUT4_TRICW|nr:SDR family oxidoreductase [Trinickia caryophylli]PMS09389.1 3-oxoacyl-ACP reductase [Trinickia caryophylli]TRX18096.1 SDR family oxidoreductase [Trinickia caryophylli]WQE11122.1 SDR family oxidoreductase [Trinickia caryophylli]SMF75067.1 NAD(P)-dependent dehydrogenase, short-chain alcohol dehydrogenase family [Trinickia caryophylli]GLU35280.1 glucose-1-dehydrogenase [Trinickia caryophylli]